MIINAAANLICPLGEVVSRDIVKVFAAISAWCWWVLINWYAPHLQQSNANNVNQYINMTKKNDIMFRLFGVQSLNYICESGKLL